MLTRKNSNTAFINIDVFKNIMKVSSTTELSQLADLIAFELLDRDMSSTDLGDIK